ncbi:MAG TPA: shikimate dehydrogenase [Blastocatellia bacterium]|nr:shikimate dehydrogenase [Blastocatellia bacterium]
MLSEPPRTCAVITEQTCEAARDAIIRAAAQADIIELRLDYLRDLDFTRPENLGLLLSEKPCPVIITCRAASEGGLQRIADDARLRLLVEGARQVADYCDIEAVFYNRATRLNPDLSRLIVSYHNFDETPAGLESIYQTMSAMPAAVYKIATRARSVEDSLSIFRLLELARNEGKRIIALGMGEPGIITRLIGPSRGSFLTYGSLERGAESAPGQVTCEELKNLYRIDRISSATLITGIIGRPVSHSASPVMHNRAFDAHGLDAVYLPIEVDDPVVFFDRFVRPSSREIDWNLRGLSVTIPHKTAVLPLLDELDETARAVGAVNTLVIEGNRVKGYNTDVEGAMGPLLSHCSIEDERFGVIGAGGAARAVIYGLLKRGARVEIFARDVKKAKLLADSFDDAAIAMTGSIESIASSDATVLINTTPVGMRGHSEGESPVPCEAFEGRSLAYDLVYNPLETRFLKEALAAGCRTISGIEMLAAQAALQFELWTGERPSVELLREAVMEKLTSAY